MKKYIYSILAATAFVAAGCSDNDVVENLIPDEQKDLMEFSSSVETGGAASSTMTRAGFTGGTEYGSTTYSTEIVARFSSANNDATPSVRHTKTLLSAVYDANAEKGANWKSYSTVDYVSGHKRYWDDAWGRSANLSIYAVAVPNYASSVKNPAGSNASNSTLYDKVPVGSNNVSSVNTQWQTDAETDLNKINWEVSTTQTDNYDGTIAQEDLCYSHNIQTATDGSTELKYGKGKDGVRSWNAHSGETGVSMDAAGYPNYLYSDNGTDKYPTLDDGIMKFRLTDTGANASATGPGHFDRGHMIFHHALTRITINLKKSTDDGFKSDGTDFVLTSNNVQLLDMHYKGTLNIKDGTWSAYTTGSSTNNTTITTAKKATAESGNDYTCFAQVIPGYVLGSTSTTNVMQFTVSNNTYYITQKQLYDAIKELPGNDSNGNPLVTISNNTIALEQGKNYVFTITVKKTGIQSVTCSLVPWIDVTGSATATNDYVQISLTDAKNDKCRYFDLYRMNDDVTDIYAPTTGPGTGTDWTKNYNWLGTTGTAESQNYKDKATLTETGSNTNVWKTNWFWESNKSFYHFRTVNTGMTIQENATTTADYFKVYGGPIQDYDATHTEISTAQNASGKVNDYHWGAPFKSGANLKYDVTYGWSAETDADGQIYPAIGSTSQTINMIEHHMMSNIRIVLKTTKDDTKTNKLGEGSVNLSGSVITITNFYNEGQVEMGRGIVTANGTLVSTQTMTAPASAFKTSGDNTETNQYTYRVVPQALYRTNAPSTETDLTKFIGLTITTPDNNQYYVIKKLSEIIATSVKQSGTEYAGSNQQKDAAVLRWYPGHDYTYTITISKKGIEAITCTVVDWIEVTGSNINIDLES